MLFENVASQEYAKNQIDNIMQMFGEPCRDEMEWSKLSHGERAIFCRLAGVPEKLATKRLVDLNPDSRREILIAIKRAGEISSRFHCDSLQSRKYRAARISNEGC